MNRLHKLSLGEWKLKSDQTTLCIDLKFIYRFACEKAIEDNKQPHLSLNVTRAPMYFHVITNRTCVSSVLCLNASNSLDAYTYAMCCGFKYMLNKRRYAINSFQESETSQTNWRNLQPIVEKVDKVRFILNVKSSLFTRLSTRITI